MKKRKQINYEDIVEIGISLIKEETDLLYGESEKNKAESVMRICGIVDFLRALDEATIVYNPEKSETEQSSEESEEKINQECKLNENENWIKFLNNTLCNVISLSDEDFINYSNFDLKGL